MISRLLGRHTAQTWEKAHHPPFASSLVWSGLSNRVARHGDGGASCRWYGIACPMGSAQILIRNPQSLRPQRDSLNWERQRRSAPAASINSVPEPLKAYYSIRPTCCPQEIHAFRRSVCHLSLGSGGRFFVVQTWSLVQGHPPSAPALVRAFWLAVSGFRSFRPSIFTTTVTQPPRRRPNPGPNAGA